MPFLLTDDQLHKIAAIIAKHHSVLVLKVLGPGALSEAEIRTLKTEGLYETAMETMGDAYKYGKLLGRLETIRASQMGYAEFQKKTETEPVPLSEPEKLAVAAANHRAGTYIRNLGSKVIQRANSIVLEEDQTARAELLGGVRTEVAENIIRREGLSRLTRRLRELDPDRQRNWTRVAITEKHNAMQQGLADSFHSEGGGDTLVFKRPMPDACPRCRSLHLGPDGAPRIFKLTYLQNNGTNVGRKASEWLPVVGGVHPFCQCMLQKIPEGWGFDEDGDMVPGGAFGTFYESPDEVEKAVVAEDRLRKAFAVKQRVDYRGLPIAIEHPIGARRPWTDEAGETQYTTMQHAYGFIEGTRGPDGDEYDVFIGPDPSAELVYIVHQNRADLSGWDEDKAMVGFSNLHQATESYLSHYDDPKFLGPISVVPFSEFAAKVMETVVPGSIQVDGMVKAVEPHYIGADSKMENRNVSGTGTTIAYTDLRPHIGNRKPADVIPAEEFARTHSEPHIQPIVPATVLGERPRFVIPMEIPEQYTTMSESARAEKKRNRAWFKEKAKIRGESTKIDPSPSSDLKKSHGEWLGLRVVAIGPRGGQIVGYSKGKPIYAGSAQANKMAASKPAKAETKEATPPAGAPSGLKRWMPVTHDGKDWYVSGIHKDGTVTLKRANETIRVDATAIGTKVQQIPERTPVTKVAPAKPPEKPEFVVKQATEVERWEAKVAEAEAALEMAAGNLDETRAHTTASGRLNAAEEAFRDAKDDLETAKEMLEEARQKTEQAAEQQAKPAPTEPKLVVKDPEPKEPTKPEEVPQKLERVGDHIWGSRKDLASLGAINSSADLENMSSDDAAILIRKSKLIDAPTLDEMRTQGMSPGAAHMTLALLAAIKAKPDNTPAARAAYLDKVREIQGGLKDVRTLDEFKAFIDEMDNEQRRGSSWEQVGDRREDKNAALEQLKKLEADNPGVKFRAAYQYGSFVVQKQVAKPYDALGSRFTRFIQGRSKHKDFQAAYETALTVDGKWSYSKQGNLTEEQGWAYLMASTQEAKKQVKKVALVGQVEKILGQTTRGHSKVKARKGVTRTGGLQIKDANPERIAKTFGLREIDYGDYLSQADREHHTIQLEQALHDLTDVLELPPDVVSLKGRIGIALGARGRGNAKAHYEPGRKAINITKFKGGGSVAHEWGHAMDNIVSEHYIPGSENRSEPFLTTDAQHSKVPTELREAVQGVLDAMLKHPDPEWARKEHAALVEKASKQTEELIDRNNKLVREANEISKMPTPDRIEGAIRNARANIDMWKKEIADLEAKIKARPNASRGQFGDQRKIDIEHRKYWIQQREEKIELYRKTGGRTPEQEKRLEDAKAEVEGLRGLINQSKREEKKIREIRNAGASDLLKNSVAQGSYYSKTVELFARSFETYVHEKLKAAGRENSYLVDGMKMSIRNPDVYPQGEELKRVMTAMDKLMDTMREGEHLKKSLEALEALQ